MRRFLYLPREARDLFSSFFWLYARVTFTILPKIYDGLNFVLRSRVRVRAGPSTGRATLVILPSIYDTFLFYFFARVLTKCLDDTRVTLTIFQSDLDDFPKKEMQIENLLGARVRADLSPRWGHPYDFAKNI